MTLSGTLGIPVDETIANVWVKWTNAHGGVNGHPVQLTVLDDAGNPARAASAAKELVERDDVLAIVGAQTVVGEGIVQYANQMQVPLVGGRAPAQFSGVDLATPYAFPSTGTNIGSQLGGIVQTAKLAKATKLANFYCVEAEICALNAKHIAQLAESAGIDLVHNSAISATAPDYTAPCLRVKASGAEALGIETGIAPTERAILTCREQGYSGIFVAPESSVNPSFNEQQPELSGVYLIGLVWSFHIPEDARTSGQREYVQAVDKYAPGLFTSREYSSDAQNTWTAFQLFLAAAEKGDIGPNSTREDLLNGLYGLSNETLGGISPPLTFERSDKTHAVNCYFVSAIQDGKRIYPFGTDPRCIE